MRRQFRLTRCPSPTERQPSRSRKEKLRSRPTEQRQWSESQLSLLREDRSITDQSDANFTVQRRPYITLLRPNGGEVWTIGQYQNIHWNRQNPGGNTVDSDYSTDNGATWLRTATQAKATGWYFWTVPGPATTTAKVRIRFHETPSLTDMSDAVFTIVGPT